MALYNCNGLVAPRLSLYNFCFYFTRFVFVFLVCSQTSNGSDKFGYHCSTRTPNVSVSKVSLVTLCIAFQDEHALKSGALMKAAVKESSN